MDAGGVCERDLAEAVQVECAVGPVQVGGGGALCRQVQCGGWDSSAGRAVTRAVSVSQAQTVAGVLGSAGQSGGFNTGACSGCVSHGGRCRSALRESAESGAYSQAVDARPSKGLLSRFMSTPSKKACSLMC